MASWLATQVQALMRELPHQVAESARAGRADSSAGTPSLPDGYLASNTSTQSWKIGITLPIPLFSGNS